MCASDSILDILWYVKVKSLSHVRLFATPWTIAYQAPPSMGFSRPECWRGLPFPSPGDLPDPGIEPRSPSLQADTLPSEPPGKIILWYGFPLINEFFFLVCNFTVGLRASVSTTWRASSWWRKEAKRPKKTNLAILDRAYFQSDEHLWLTNFFVEVIEVFCFGV